MTIKDVKSSINVILLAVGLLVLASPSWAIDADSELVQSLARNVSRSLAAERAAFAPLPSRSIAPLAATMPGAFSLAPAAVIEPVALPTVPAVSQSSKSFPILAATYIGLNALDIYTTTKAIQRGSGVEANPILAPAASTPVALTAMKIATTATTLVIARRLWKEHRTAGIVLMVAANIGTGFVVGHNAAVATR